MQSGRAGRRAFIALLGGAVASPLMARAQPAERIRRIGVLVLGNPSPEPFLKELRQGLLKLGMVEGRDYRLDIRSAGAKASALPDTAAELVRLKVDIIVAWQTPAAAAAKKATTEIPIVMTSGNPVETGIVESLSRPGGNVTGVDSFGAQLGGKCIELIRDTLPAARRVAVLANAADPFTKSFVAEIAKSANSVGIALQTIMLRPGDDFGPAFGQMRQEGAEALIIQPTLLRPAAIELAAKQRLPTFSITPTLPRSGGVMAISASLAPQLEDVARYVDRILKGSKPADLPVIQPTRFELAVNLKAARAIGLVIPEGVLARADEIME